MENLIFMLFQHVKCSTPQYKNVHCFNISTSEKEKNEKVQFFIMSLTFILLMLVFQDTLHNRFVAYIEIVDLLIKNANIFTY